MDMNMVCAIIMATAVLGGLIHRIKTGKGIGLRFCQYMIIAMGIPAIVMLAFADKLEKQVVASLIGALFGYLMAQTGKDE